jgi:hypothetical protein
MNTNFITSSRSQTSLAWPTFNPATEGTSTSPRKLDDYLTFASMTNITEADRSRRLDDEYLKSVPLTNITEADSSFRLLVISLDYKYHFSTAEGTCTCTTGWIEMTHFIYRNTTTPY